MNFKKFGIAFMALVGTLMAAAQSEALTNKIFLPTVKTVLCYSSVADYAFPIINLNSTEHIDLSFDELKATNESYCYTLVLCNADWKPVAMQPNEYLVGNAFEQITNYTYSVGTYQKYVHYGFSFPTESMNVKYAGNYIVKVYRNFNLDDLVLTQRCYVVNSKVGITNRVHRATNIDLRYSSQEVDVDVDISSTSIPSPYTDAKLSILQNGRYDNAITTLTPKYINGNDYNYDYEDGNVFFGGNEFRAFDMRNLRSVGQNVSTKKIDTAIHVFLKLDEARGAQQHLTTTDFNGKYIIANSVAGDPNSLDYAYVTYTLSSFSGASEPALYVLGAFNNYQPSEECRMKYDEANKVYQCTMLLKQGYYNYYYAYRNKDQTLEDALTEGDHYETENDYYFFFYQKNYTYNFEELIGFQKGNSGLGERR